MATIIMSKPASRLEPAMKRKAYAFIEKLTADDTAPGLHIEPIHGSADPRVRTGRVDDRYRAVMFRVPQGTTAAYVLYGIWPHDDAITMAKKARLQVNPVSGIAEIIEAAPTAPVGREPAGIKTAVTEPPQHAFAGQPVPGPEQRPAAGQPVPIPEQRPAAGQPLPATPLLQRLGLTSDQLVHELGIDAQVAAKALTLTDEGQLLNLAAEAVEWQGLALLDLASGHSLVEVKEKFAIPAPGVQPQGSEDEQLLKGLQHPAARITFAWIESNDELRRVIEGGDFAAWRVFLHPEQRKYATRSYNGPFRLSGGAGTGKTVVLLHRARHLAHADPSARVLMTTFTTNLADQMHTDIDRLDPELTKASGLGQPGVHVTGIDALASAVLKRAGADIAADAEAVLGVATTQVAGRTSNETWQAAIAAAGSTVPMALKSDAFFAAEYTTVILPNRIVDRQGYYRVRRPGRGVALDRAKRAAVWDVVEAYRAQARIAGTVDFAEAATLAATWCQRIAQEQGEYLADHVLVDEGQDLTPAHWQLLRALVGEHANDLFIAEDSHQRIYGQRLVLSAYGIRIVGRSQRLTLNYRTTAQNLAWAVRVLEGGTFVDLEEGAEKSSDYRSARSGPKPRLFGCANLSEELDNAARLITAWVGQVTAPETVAILVRYSSQRDRVVTGLAERGVTVRAVDRGSIKAGQPVVMTMHRAKGTEFARVLLFGINEGSIPSPMREQNYSENAAADALLRERSLLYVAATRARDELAISWSGVASDFLTV